MDPNADLKLPAIALAISGLAGFLLYCLVFFSSIGMFVIGLQGRGADEELIPVAVALFLVSLVDMAAGVLIAAGGWAMRSGPTTLAKVAAVVAVIPCLNPLGLLGLPFGIWALVAMNNAGQRAQPSTLPNYG
jgi:hypothetical protein